MRCLWQSACVRLSRLEIASLLLSHRQLLESPWNVSEAFAFSIGFGPDASFPASVSLFRNDIVSSREPVERLVSAAEMNVVSD